MAFKLGMTVDLCMAYMLMLVSMTLILMKGHSGSQRQKISIGIISTTKQAITVQLATMVGQFLSDLDYKKVYVA